MPNQTSVGSWTGPGQSLTATCAFGARDEHSLLSLLGKISTKGPYRDIELEFGDGG